MNLEKGLDKQPTTTGVKDPRRLRRCQNIFIYILFAVGIAVSITLLIVDMIKTSSEKTPVPEIEVASMVFSVRNITETRLSAKWDLSIRIPESIPGRYICLQGDLQASFLYKNVTLATSPPQRYSDLKYYNPQLLRVSAVVSGEDIGGLIGKDIMEDINEKNEVRFGSRFYLTDCREKTSGIMSYACDEVTLRFEPGSEMKAALFGKNPSCVNF